MTTATDSQIEYIENLREQLKHDLDPANRMGAKYVFTVTAEFTVETREQMKALRSNLQYLYTEFSTFVMGKFSANATNKEQASALIDQLKNRDYQKLTLEFFENRSN